jgi:hypothetical protein
MKRTVLLYQEVYTEIEVEAETQEEAGELVMSGEFKNSDIRDVTYKNGEIQ